MDAVWRMGEMNRLLTFFPLTGGTVCSLVPVIRVFLIRVDKTTETVSLKDKVTPYRPSPRSAVSTECPIFGFGISDVVVGPVCRQIPHLEFAIVSQHG